jgi:hypothetical protein
MARETFIEETIVVLKDVRRQKLQIEVLNHVFHRTDETKGRTDIADDTPEVFVVVTYKNG